MLRGYNTPYHALRDVIDKPLKREALVDYLKGKDLILRYPDGQGTINEKRPFYSQETQDFISLCQDAEVSKVVLRAAFHDVQGSWETYQHLSSALEVIYVEADNEPWLAPNNTPVTNYERRLAWQQALFGWLIGPVYDRYLANRYADRTLDLMEQFYINVGGDIVDKFAFTSPLPVSPEKNEWWRILSNRLSNLEIVSFHIYNGVGPDFDWSFFDNRIKSQVGDSFRKICTEGNGFHFGQHGWTNFTEYAFKAEHRRQHNHLIELLESNQFELFLWHSGWGSDPRRKFQDLIISEDGVLNKRTDDTWR